MKNNKLSRVFVFVLILASTVYGSLAAFQLLFNSKAPYSLICKGLLLQESKVYLFSNKPFLCKTDSVMVNVSNKLMPKILGTLSHKSGEWKFYTAKSISDPTIKDSINPFLPWCVDIDNKFYRGNDSIQEKYLQKGIKFNRPGGDKINDRFLVRLSEIKDQTILNTRSSGLGVSYPVFSSVDSNFYEVDFGDVPFDTSLLSNKIFSFPYSYGSENSRYKIKVSTRGLLLPVYTIYNNRNEMVESATGKNFHINNVVFEIASQLSIWLKISFILYLVLLLGFQLRLFFKFCNAPNPFFSSIVSLSIGFNSLLFLGMPLLILALQQDTGRWGIMLLALFLNLNIFIIFHKIKNVLPWNFIFSNVFKYSRIFLWLVFFLGCGSLFLAKNESVFGLPILHLGKGLILLLIFLFRFRDLLPKYSGKSLILKVILANMENAIVIVFSAFISIITHDIGSFIFTLCAILLISLISNRKNFALPLIIFVLVIVALVLGASQLNSSFLNNNRKAYRLVSWVLPPTSFQGANEADMETSSDHYFLLKNKFQHPEPQFTDTSIPANWRTVFFSDYAVLWSFILGGWIFLLLSLGVILFLSFHLLRLILISLHVFRVNKDEVFYFPERKSKVLVFLLALTLIQFIYPFLSNFLCISLTGQSVPLLSASKVEVFFLIILITALHYIYNLKNYYQPVTNFKKGQFLRSYSRLSRNLIGIITLLAFFILSAITLRGSMLNLSSPDMAWHIYYEDDKDKGNDTIKSAGDKTALIYKAQSFIADDPYVAIPRIKTEYLKNLVSYFYCGKPYRKVFFRSNDFHNSQAIMQSKISYDSAASFKKIFFDDNSESSKYAVHKFNNGKPITVITNKYLSGFPIDSKTINTQLQVELNKALEKFVATTGTGNTGSVIVADNTTGNLISTASFPFIYNNNSTAIDHFNAVNPNKIRLISDGIMTNTANSYLLPGSLVKPIIAYAALKNMENAENIVYDGCSFLDFLKNSDDAYSAELFRNLMLTPIALDKTLHDDFGINLYSPNEDALIDQWPMANDYNKKLDRLNPIYRLSIGQQQTFTFKKIVEIYSRIASGTIHKLSYERNEGSLEPISLSTNKLSILHQAMNGALFGTANKVRLALETNGIDHIGFICKTGTAQKKGSQSNATSSFILCTERYTIGIQLAGDIPENKTGLSAKILFINIIPLLQERGIF